MLGLTVAQVRAWVRSGLLEPERGPHGELRFSRHDLAVLRQELLLPEHQLLVPAQVGAERRQMPTVFGQWLTIEGGAFDFEEPAPVWAALAAM